MYDNDIPNVADNTEKITNLGNADIGINAKINTKTS